MATDVVRSNTASAVTSQKLCRPTFSRVFVEPKVPPGPNSRRSQGCRGRFGKAAKDPEEDVVAEEQG